MQTIRDDRHYSSLLRVPRPAHAHFSVWFIAYPMWLAVFGCGSRPAYQFDSLDLVPVREEVSELSLGKYTIPIPVIEGQPGTTSERANGVQLDFELHALVSRDEKAELAGAWQRHSGKLRDRVIRVCRNASLDELHEPELESLKTRLMDAIEAQLGENDIRQLVITEFVSQPL